MGAEGDPQEFFFHHPLSCGKFSLAAGLEDREMLVMSSIAASLPEHWESIEVEGPAQTLSLGSVMGSVCCMRKSNSGENEPSREVSCKCSLSWSGDLKHELIPYGGQRRDSFYIPNPKGHQL